ncbi:MAG: hypothetical protein WC781_04335 [Candidatus Pacearchaeota archaeon]|jgi:hypothetical protein
MNNLSRKQFLKSAGLSALLSLGADLPKQPMVAQVEDKTKSNIQNREQDYKELGDNCLKEPAYVKKHFWTELTPNNDWKTHIERFDYDSDFAKFVFDYDGSGFCTVLRDIDKSTGKIKLEGFIWTWYEPLTEQLGLEEYIEDKEGNVLLTFSVKQGEYVRCNYGGNCYTFNLREIEKNPAPLLEKNKNLSPLIHLKHKDILKIKEFRRNKAEKWLSNLAEQNIEEISNNPDNIIYKELMGIREYNDKITHEEMIKINFYSEQNIFKYSDALAIKLKTIKEKFSPFLKTNILKVRRILN